MHSCTLWLTINSLRSFSGPTCDCNASLVQCQDMVQRPVKFYDPLKKEGTPQSLSPDFYMAWNRKYQRDGRPSS